VLETNAAAAWIVPQKSLHSPRTGTVFLTHWINSNAGTEIAVHEPPFSRAAYLLGNLFAYRGWSRSGLVSLYMAIRKRRLIESKGYIELNPFLCPIADLLADTSCKLKVAHLVRDPRTWVPSLISHEASGRRRFLIRKVPFNMPREREFDQEWRTMTLIEKMLWRWSSFNRRISTLEHGDCQYEWFRYEDLFSGDAETRDKSRGRLLQFLDLAPTASPVDTHPGRQINASLKNPQFEFSNWTGREIKFMEDVAGDQMRRFHYQ
jgi:hypothetical protein